MFATPSREFRFTVIPLLTLIGQTYARISSDPALERHAVTTSCKRLAHALLAFTDYTRASSYINYFPIRDAASSSTQTIHFCRGLRAIDIRQHHHDIRPCKDAALDVRLVLAATSDIRGCTTTTNTHARDAEPHADRIYPGDLEHRGDEHYADAGEQQGR